MVVSLEDRLAELDELGIAELRDRWARLTGRPVPQLGTPTLRLVLAYEIQARTLGGLSRRTQQKLEQLAAAKSITRGMTPGMRLVREWNGTVHIVTVGDAGEVQWNGKTWRSLSEVARAITGTRWSGPAFFGLKQNRKAAA